MKVWVVMKSCGEWSDKTTDVDSVWTDEERADARCDELGGVDDGGEWCSWCEELELDQVPA